MTALKSLKDTHKLIQLLIKKFYVPWLGNLKILRIFGRCQGEFRAGQVISDSERKILN